MGNLTQIGRMLLALYMAYVARNCAVIGQGVKNLLWVLSLTIGTITVVAAVYNLVDAVSHVIR